MTVPQTEHRRSRAHSALRPWSVRANRGSSCSHGVMAGTGYPRRSRGRSRTAGGTVTVAARRREDAVEVSVEDQGVGIPHAEQERIFRKFYRGDSAASGVVGTGAAGLGLFLAAGLVTAMGGKIRVDSSEGNGSTFVLELRAVEIET